MGSVTSCLQNRGVCLPSGSSCLSIGSSSPRRDKSKKDQGVTDVVRLRIRHAGSSGPKSMDFRQLLLLPDPQREIKQAYDEFEQIGTGAFGTVWKATHKQSGDHVAIKQIPKTGVASDNEFVYAELESMIKLDHPNVVKFHEYFEDDKTLYLVTELCGDGDFSDLSQYDEKEAKSLYRDVMSAVAYCHDLEVAHRDLKFENCLLHKMQNQRRVGKVIDFGLAAIKHQNEETAQHWLNEQVGTRYFIAPEVINQQINYGVECDCWSLGVMLYIILTDEHPIAPNANRMEPKQFFRKVLTGKVRQEPLEDANVPEPARDLLHKLLAKEPSKRLTANAALKSEFLSKNSTRAVSWKSKSTAARSSRRSDDDMKVLRSDVVNRIQTFTDCSRFEKAILTVLAHQSHYNQVNELGDAFRMLDESETGSLSKDEIRRGLQQCGTTFDEAELETLFQTLDQDATGKVYYTEWLAATMKPSVVASAKATQQVFDFLDIEGTGRVEKSDLVKILGDNAEVEAALESADIRKDGAVSFEEFSLLMQNLAKRLEATPKEV